MCVLLIENSEIKEKIVRIVMVYYFKEFISIFTEDFRGVTIKISTKNNSSIAAQKSFENVLLARF